MRHCLDIRLFYVSQKKCQYLINNQDLTPYIRQYEKAVDLLERELKFKIFSTIKEALEVFYLIRLVEIVGNIADHAQNASDRMRAMIAK